MAIALFSHMGEADKIKTVPEHLKYKDKGQITLIW